MKNEAEAKHIELGILFRILHFTFSILHSQTQSLNIRSGDIPDKGRHYKTALK